MTRPITSAPPEALKELQKFLTAEGLPDPGFYPNQDLSDYLILKAVSNTLMGYMDDVPARALWKIIGEEDEDTKKKESAAL